MSERRAPPGTETCACCAGVAASTPRSIENRGGLSEIGYRIGEYAQFKETMIAGLSSPEFPELDGLRTREADDYTLGLVDAVACAADVLTFYQERIVNESYLRTATELVSLQEMGKLIGHRLRPGVAAETRLAFALETPPEPPPGLALEPGAFVTGIPASLTLAPGVKVQSVPGPDEKPQTFETVEEIAARPEWSAVRPWMSAVRAPGWGATETWLKGVLNHLKAGDALVFVHPEFHAHPTTNGKWDFRLIDDVFVHPDGKRTRVSWTHPLRHVSEQAEPVVPPQVHVLRTRAGIFGHNAPMWGSMSRQFRRGYPGGTSATEWPDFTISERTSGLADAYVDLDGVHAEIRPGGVAVLARVAGPGAGGGGSGKVWAEGSEVHRLYKVSSTTEVSRAAFALSGKVTRIGVKGRDHEDFWESVRDTTVHAQSEALELAVYPVTADVGGDQIPLAIPPDGLTAGRRLIVIGRRASDKQPVVHEARLAGWQADANGIVATISPPLAAALARETVVIHANVALATHGETAVEILGSGDASKSHQRFELKRRPLTYRSADDEIGADSELVVRVGDVEWSEKPTLFGAGPTERAFVLVTDEHGRVWVTFGDGVRGARLPSGVNNIRARYRQGLGREANVANKQLTQLITRPLGLKSVSNPSPAEGGTDPEPAGEARRTIPLGTRALGRAVSLLDYEDFAMAFAGVTKAQAAVVHLGAGPTIAITLAGQDGARLSEQNPIWNNLWQALKAGGDPLVNVALLSYQASTFRLGLKVKRDPVYERNPLLAAVEAALRAHYGFDARSLGEPVLQSDVIAVVHAVPGVVAVDLDFLYGGTAPEAQTVKSLQTRLLASRMRASAGATLPAELLTLDPAPLDRLEEMP